MTTLKHTRPVPAMAHNAKTAADLMTPNPLAIRSTMSVLDAANFLALRGMIAAPVIDEVGRHVGILRSSDIRRHQARSAAPRAGSQEYPASPTWPGYSEIAPGHDAKRPVTVSEIMTRESCCVRLETPAVEVLEKFLALQVRRLFVVDGLGVLVGAVSTHDMLRELRRWSVNSSVGISI